jgi:hypothetical protein
MVQISPLLLPMFSEKNRRKKGIIFSIAYFRHLEKKSIFFCTHNTLKLTRFKNNINILFLSV